MFATILDAQIGATLANMIREAFGPCAAKLSAPYADASHRTMEKVLQVRCELGAWKLLRMIRHPGFREVLRAYINHIDQQEADVLLWMAINSAKRGGVGAHVDRLRVERDRHPDYGVWDAAACGGTDAPVAGDAADRAGS